MTDIYVKISAAQPELGELVGKLQDNTTRLLHTQQMENMQILLPQMKDKQLVKSLFEQNLKPIADKLSPVSFIKCVGMVLRKAFDDSEKAQQLEFLDQNYAPFKIQDSDDKKVGQMQHTTRASKRDYLDCRALYKCLRAVFLVRGLKSNDKDKADKDKVDEAKDLVEEVQKELESRQDVSAFVWSWFHQSELELYDATRDLSKYYRAGINFLRWTALSQINSFLGHQPSSGVVSSGAGNAGGKESAVSKAEMSTKVIHMFLTKLGIAVLATPGEFNFGELLEMEIWDYNKDIWIYNLLLSYLEGRHDLFEKAIAESMPELKKIPDFLAQKGEPSMEGGLKFILKEKFACCALMEFAFKQPKNKRRINLTELANEIKFADIEGLLINAMCADLIKGSIDQVAQMFSYTWVKPRHLDTARLQLLQTRVNDWIGSAKEVLSQVEEMTPELLVS